MNKIFFLDNFFQHNRYLTVTKYIINSFSKEKTAKILRDVKKIRSIFIINKKQFLFYKKTKHLNKNIYKKYNI